MTKRFKLMDFEDNPYIVDLTGQNERDCGIGTYEVLDTERIVDLLNTQHETIQHLNKVIERTEYSNNLKDWDMHKAQMNELQYKQKVKSILQQNYNFHKNNFDIYGAIAIQNVAKELGVDLE